MQRNVKQSDHRFSFKLSAACACLYFACPGITPHRFLLSPAPLLSVLSLISPVCVWSLHLAIRNQTVIVYVRERVFSHNTKAAIERWNMLMSLFLTSDRTACSFCLSLSLSHCFLFFSAYVRLSETVTPSSFASLLPFHNVSLCSWVLCIWVRLHYPSSNKNRTTFCVYFHLAKLVRKGTIILQVNWSFCKG